MLPEVARTQSNKVWFIPTEFTAALSAISKGFGGPPDTEGDGVSWRPAGDSPLGGDLPPTSLTDPAEALAEARRESAAATADATRSGTLSGHRFDPSVEAGQVPDEPEPTPPPADVPPDPQGPPPPPPYQG